MNFRWYAALLRLASILAFPSCDDPTGSGDGQPEAEYHLRSIFVGELASDLSSAAAVPIASLNNNGELALTSKSGTAYLWADGNLTTLGVGVAKHINDSGQIVGWALDGTRDEAVVWGKDGIAQTVYTAAGGRTRAISVDDQGTIVAYWRSENAGCGPGSNCPTRIVRISGQTVTTLGAGNITPAAANGSGLIVGWEQLNSLHFRPFLLKGSTYSQLDAGVGSHGYALDLNERGDIVGTAGPSTLGSLSGLSAVRWGATDGRSFVLPGASLGSAAYGTNEVGDIVGFTRRQDTLEFDAVLWRQGEEIVKLDEILDVNGWTLLGAIDINDRGEILAWGRDPSGQPTVVLLEPII